MKHRILGENRDWRPGDGLNCGHAAKAPAELPCGRPVKANVREQSSRPGGPKRTVVTPLCQNHAMEGITPSALLIKARREAFEELAAAHWDEFQKYLKAAIERLAEEST
ncbi:hypothetical protein ACIOD2_32265 [Amycolatopsis sp. NPDC088138]|uniref:hypothetical protein n=1 Tax=Amycolatopsis sp. NPDC088138 TaxID=3363938 RepID=UPI00382305A2